MKKHTTGRGHSGGRARRVHHVGYAPDAKTQGNKRLASQAGWQTGLGMMLRNIPRQLSMLSDDGLAEVVAIIEANPGEVRSELKELIQAEVKLRRR